MVEQAAQWIEKDLLSLSLSDTKKNGSFIYLVVFVILVIGYLITNFTTANADAFMGVIPKNMGTIAPVFFFSMLSGIICFVLGFFLYTMV